MLFIQVVFGNRGIRLENTTICRTIKITVRQPTIENLYKLLRLKKSQQSVAENGGRTTDEVLKMFHKSSEERKVLA